MADKTKNAKATEAPAKAPVKKAVNKKVRSKYILRLALISPDVPKSDVRIVCAHSYNIIESVDGKKVPDNITDTAQMLKWLRENGESLIFEDHNLAPQPFAIVREKWRGVIERKILYTLADAGSL
ncbi:MAG: hypothetical protein K9K86_09855 [Pseudomonadales bacterium]|nr:hypothetical protein [Pseudomonadales bacterium]